MADKERKTKKTRHPKLSAGGGETFFRTIPDNAAQNGTEPPFNNKYWNNKGRGLCGRDQWRAAFKLILQVRFRLRLAELYQPD